MNISETWPLSNGRCFINNGELNFCKRNGKRVTKYEVSSIISMEKELKHDLVQIKFRTNGKTVKKRFNFKKTGDGEKFINSVLKESPISKFEECTKRISAFSAVKKPLSILFYFLLGIILNAVIIDVLELSIPIFHYNIDVMRAYYFMFYAIIKAENFLGHKTCLLIIGIIACLCLLGALVRLIKRPEARLVQSIDQFIEM